MISLNRVDPFQIRPESGLGGRWPIRWRPGTSVEGGTWFWPSGFRVYPILAIALIIKSFLVPEQPLLWWEFFFFCLPWPLNRPWSQVSCLINMYYTYMYFYHRTLSALPHDCLPTLESGTRSRISARFMARGDETPRSYQGGTPRAGGRRPPPSRYVCAEPLRLEVLGKPQAFPFRGLGPPRAERVWGGKNRAGRTTACCNLISVRQDASLYITPISQHRVKIIGSLGKKLQQAVVLYNYVFVLLFSVA